MNKDQIIILKDRGTQFLNIDFLQNIITNIKKENNNIFSAILTSRKIFIQFL